MLPRAARKKNYPTVDISRAGCSRWCVRRNRPSLERVSSTGRLPDYDSTRKGQQGGEGETLAKRDWEKVARGAGC